MEYKPADKEMLSMIANKPIPFYVNGLSGSIIFEKDGDVIRILMTHPVSGRNPHSIAHIPHLPVVHQPASAPATQKEFTSKILREPPPPQQPKSTDATLSTEVPKSVRFAIPHQAEPEGRRHPHNRAPAHESSASSGFSKKPTSTVERPSQSIRFDICKTGKDTWDVYNGDVMIEESHFDKLNPNPDEQKLRYIFGKREAKMAIYVNREGEYFLKHGEKGNADWYKYNN